MKSIIYCSGRSWNLNFLQGYHFKSISDISYKHDKIEESNKYFFKDIGHYWRNELIRSWNKSNI